MRKTINPSVRIYINKTENRITFKIKTGYYLEFLAPEAMKLKNVPYLEITEVVFIHCNVVNNSQDFCRC